MLRSLNEETDKSMKRLCPVEISSNMISWAYKSLDKYERAREKIIDFYFFNGEKNMQTLESMELALLPRAMAWMGANDSGCSLFYQLARSLPSLFGLAGGQVAVGK